MTCFSWLHLTDLHLGIDKQDWLWPDTRDIFLKDLEQLHKKCGPWDLVLFTGDLTYQGSAQQFRALDKLLEELWDHLGKMGSDVPQLLAVPGNHDLVRPNKEEHSVELLQAWNDTDKVRKEFWRNEASSYRQVVSEAFENYVTWREKQPFLVKGLTTGMLPGDFSVSIGKRGAKLGIVGLNTAFLQLTGDDYQGKLALHTRQFHQACDGDGPAWVKRHHVCLLMTHHPPAWLNQASRKDHLNRHVTSHGRFAAHLFGHMHTNAYRKTTSGAEARRIWQARSLFGLRFFGEREERSFGYTAGKIELQADKGTLTLWPRRDTLIEGQIEIVPDYSAGKLIGEHTKPIVFDLIQRYDVQSAQPEPNDGAPVMALQTEKFEPTHLKQFLDLLDEHFNLEEFRTLCLTLDVKYDNLGGEGKIHKARELLTYLERRGRLFELVRLVKKERPKVPWPTQKDIPPRLDVVETPETLFIPPGPFQLGTPLDDSEACGNEQPPRKLTLSAYWIGRYPVTNQEYARFVLETGYTPPEHWESVTSDYPNDGWAGDRVYAPGTLGGGRGSRRPTRPSRGERQF